MAILPLSPSFDEPSDLSETDIGAGARAGQHGF
jgi:hypothetical protein